jgi:hypothetical protein
VVDGSCAVALVGLKCFKEKKKLEKKLNLKKIKIQRDPRIAIVHDGYAAALPGLKCFKGKKYKNINFKNFKK